MSKMMKMQENESLRYSEPYVHSLINMYKPYMGNVMLVWWCYGHYIFVVLSVIKCTKLILLLLLSRLVNKKWSKMTKWSYN